MSVTVHVFPDKPHARLNTEGQPPFAEVHLSHYPATAIVVLRTYAEADEFTRVAEEARRLQATLPPADGGVS